MYALVARQERQIFRYGLSHQDKLMGQIAKRVEDKRLLKLIRAFLNAGVMENGLVRPSVEGTPQGGPLSPLLSNLVLDELDRELERRGHRLVRHADDSNIYVRSERAGQRVMESVTRFITQQLKLKVNEAKSAVARPQERKFLGFSFTVGPEVKRIIAPKALDRFIQQAVMQVLQRRWDRTFPITAMGSDRGGRLIKQWHRRSSISPKATAGWWILIWRNSWIESITTN